MKIQSVNSNFYDTNRTNNVYSIYQRVPFTQNNTDRISFTCDYQKTLELFVKTNFKTDKEVETSFIHLFRELINDPAIPKFQGFHEIVKVFEQSGFRGVLNELWKAYPSEKIAAIIPKDMETALLAGTKDKPILQLFNGSRQGFWNSIFNNKNATRNVEIMFTEPQDRYTAAFQLKKNGNLQTIQRNNDISKWSEFYATTGNKKQETIHLRYGFPETTYYKKDGKPNELENHMHGGPAIPLW